MKKQSPIILLVAVYLVTLIGIIFFLPDNQDIRSQASPSTTLSFSPSSSVNSPIKKKVNETLSLDIMLYPGKNYVSLVKLHILYNPAKFRPAGTNAFVLNKNFINALNPLSKIIDGPVVNKEDGTITVTLSAGTDPKKAAKAPVNIGTINLIAIKAVSAQENLISFGAQTQAFSVAPSDNAFENVLATSMPAYVLTEENLIPSPTTTTGPSIALSTTPAPSTVVTPSPTVTISIPTPTAIVYPTSVPTAPPIYVPNPSLTPTPLPNSTVLNINTFLHGVGNSGDNVNPNGTFSNKTPQRTARTFVVSFLSTANVLLGTRTGLLIYDKDRGIYTGTINIGVNAISTGNYLLKIKTDGYLQKLIPGVQYIVTKSRTTTPPIVSLVAGDTNGDNAINILDYNLVMNCYSDITPAKACTATEQAATDFNDDTKTNHIDYNLLIREISVQNGD